MSLQIVISACADVTDRKSYALSIRMEDPTKKSDTGIKHYRIRTDDKKRYYIDSNRKFDQVVQLIENYKCRYHVYCNNETHNHFSSVTVHQ